MTEKHRPVPHGQDWATASRTAALLCWVIKATRRKLSPTEVFPGTAPLTEPEDAPSRDGAFPGDCSRLRIAR